MPVMTGSRFFAQAMEAYGVTHVFFVPTILYPALAEMEDTSVRRVLTHDEKAAGYMADGFARAGRRPGICMAQNVGAVNLAAGLRDARMAGSAVIALSGGPESSSRYRYAYQDVEDFVVFDPLTKMNAIVDSVERLPDLLRQAFRVSTSGAPGPVHLRLEGHLGTVAEDSADLELIVEEQFTRYPAFRPEAPWEAIDRAARRLLEAERPVIVAGGGVVASEAEREVVELAERLSTPVATSLAGKGVIAENHPLSVGVMGTYSRSCANKVVAEADLVFFLGAHGSNQLTNHWRIPRRGSPVIQLDIDPAELGRNYPLEIGLCGDARAALQQLLERVGKPARTDGWAARAGKLVAEWRGEYASRLESDNVPLRPERLCKEITEALPPDGVLVADTGHSAIWTGTMVELRHPGQRFLRCAGSLGWAFPASIGVKCALPDRPVLCFAGDGGLMYHLSELETAARCGINLGVVVNNNHSLNQEQRLLAAAYQGQPRGRSDELWKFREINFARVAEEMGWMGIRVERPGEIKPALEQALRNERPTLVDVVTDINALADRPWG